MTTDDATRAGFSLRRWSARKHAAARETAPGAAADGPAPAATASPEIAAGAAPQATPAEILPAADADACVPRTADEARLDASNELPPAAAELALPPVESLTPQSDFTPFMRPDVDPALKRAALRKLFTDPRFNVMDGLDVYIDDYSKPDPIAPEILRTLVQTRYIFDPPVTRVNAQGVVEDVPPEEVAAARAAAAEAANAVEPPVRDEDAGASPATPQPPDPEAGATAHAVDADTSTAAAQSDNAQLALPLSSPSNPVPAPVPQKRS
jgi:hypothetical protein